MVRNPLLRSELSHWFAGQNRFLNQKDMALAVGIPYETLRCYFKGKNWPGPKNLRRLSEITGLDLHALQNDRLSKAKIPSKPAVSKVDVKRLAYANRLVEDLHFELARCVAALVPAKLVLARDLRDGKVSQARSAQAVQALMDALQRSIQPFLNDPEALEVLRKNISGSDAGYLSGLLGAIFDNRRLQSWRDMTTYEYGSK